MFVCVRSVACVHPLTAPTGKASTAIIQSLRPISFLSCRSCSLLSAPFVNRLDTSIRTHTPKNTAWMTYERDTRREFSKFFHISTNTSKRCVWGAQSLNGKFFRGKKEAKVRRKKKPLIQSLFKAGLLCLCCASPVCIKVTKAEWGVSVVPPLSRQLRYQQRRMDVWIKGVRQQDETGL